MKKTPYSDLKGRVNDKNKVIKILILAIGIIFIITSAFALHFSSTTFSDGTDLQNISIVAGTNTTKYIYVPMGTYSTNFSILIKGVSYQ